MTEVLLSIGSNKNNPELQIETAVRSLNQRFKHVKVSSLYLTEPVGGVAQDAFINAAVVFETELSAPQLMDHLTQLEDSAQRNRKVETPNGPRNLDLDIILFGDTVLADSTLTIPHPRFRERRFVLEPLGEIAPQAVDPITGKNIKTLLNECEDTNWVNLLEAEALSL